MRIRTRAELETLLERPPTSLIPGGEAVSLELPGLTSDERAAWERKIASSYADCGCGLGAAFFLGGLAATAGVFAARSRASLLRTSGRVLLAAAAVMGLSLAGKVLGLWLARRRLRRDVRELAARLGR